MDAKTYLAIGELVQTAAHAHGLTGPVQFTVCRPLCYPLDMETIEIRKDRDPRRELRILNECLKQIAARIGPQHSFWDEILDNEAFLEDRPTLLDICLGQRIENARQLIDEHNAPTDRRIS